MSLGQCRLVLYKSIIPYIDLREVLGDYMQSYISFKLPLT